MKKNIFLFFISIILIFSIFLVNSSSNENEKNKISDEIYEELESNETVAVIIKIKSEPKDIEEQKEIIKENIKDKDIGETKELISAEISEKELKELEKNENIEKIFISHSISAFLQDSVPLINASAVWNLQTSGINITGIGETICVIDTGVNFTHPGLITKNKTCIIDCFNKACVENCSVHDDNGHGTHVAGIAAANRSINGVAIGANLIGVKVLDSNGNGHATNAELDLVNAIDWCVLNRNLYNISVITMSLGTSVLNTTACDSTFTDTWTKSIDNATLMNISVIAATGNSGSGILRNTTAIAAPACITNSTSVSATDKDDSISSYGHYNSLTDFFAPGTNINSTYNGGYAVESGTSMATPHVAGAFAIIRQFFRLQTGEILTPLEIQNSLNLSGKRISTGSYSIPRIDIYLTIKELDYFNPIVNLVSPQNNTYSINTSQIFVCNAQDVQLKNITFYLWNETGVYNTSTIDITTNQNISFSQILTSGSYKWNCFAVDENGNSSFASSNYSITITGEQMIVIGVDGFQYNHYVEMFNAGVLGNFTRLIGSTGWSGTLNITGHTNTETAPGNAELHTGLNETLNGISDNDQGIPAPDNTIEYERLKNFDSLIKVGSIYGKSRSYLSAIFDNSFQETDWWQNRSTYLPTAWTDGTACDNSIDIAEKATEFIGNYSNNSFYLFVYFGAPDCSGHAAGENSVNYNNSFINVDSGLGILLNSLEENNIDESVSIIITADHGWNEGTTGHGTANSDTIVLPLITNNAVLVANITSDGIREQCEIVPTILDYFGAETSDYPDIINNGCESMIGDLTAPIISSISSSVTTTSATISWTTNENANSSVNYGTTNDLEGIVSNLGLATSHSISLSSLSSSTTYYYNVTSCDASNNCNTTGTNSFTTSTPTPVGSSGGSGGGSAITTMTYVATPKQASLGYNKQLEINDQIKFSFFDAKSEEHILTITQLGAGFVDLIIQSEPIKLNLRIGQSAKLNLSSAVYYDLYVKLNSIKDNKADIILQTIHEEIPKPVQITASVVEETENKTQEKPLEKNIEDFNFEITKLQRTIQIILGIFIILITFLLFRENIIKTALKIKKRQEHIKAHKEKFREIKPKENI